MGTTDKRVGLAEQRILGGPRPQPMSSPRVNRSSSEDMDLETKKKSVFKRALKGLSMKGGGDMKHIEDMLMQLLDEVESLKHVNQLSLDQQARSNSLTSQRAAPTLLRRPINQAICQTLRQHDAFRTYTPDTMFLRQTVSARYRRSQMKSTMSVIMLMRTPSA
jgi:hypothetical protein